MRRIFRTFIIAILALVAFGTLSACSGSSSTGTPSESSAPSSSAATAATPSAFPASARYMADMEMDGKKMTIGISVDGTEVTAYACNGIDDEAWFFGKQADGAIDITSVFRDTLSASFNGSDVTGDLTMNGITYDFAAAAVTEPAGMYTADLDGVRASWIVRPDGSATGVQSNGGSGRREAQKAELAKLSTSQFRNEVRNTRLLQQADQSIALENGTLISKINGRTVTATVVTGTTRFS